MSSICITIPKSISWKENGFRCTTTGKDWGGGNYISRTGKFHYLKKPYPMKGFMGFRKVNDRDFE